MEISIIIVFLGSLVPWKAASDSRRTVPSVVSTQAPFGGMRSVQCRNGRHEALT